MLLGDGEMQEGQVWEAAMSAAHFRLDNLCVVVDRNEMQVEGHTDRVLGMEPVDDKWRAFGWHVQHVDGHDVAALRASFSAAREVRGRPSVIVAATIPCRGVPFLEGQRSHNMRLPPDVAAAALKALGEV